MFYLAAFYIVHAASKGKTTLFWLNVHQGRHGRSLRISRKGKMDISICPLGLFVTISCGPVLRGFLLWVKMPRKQTAGHRCFQNAPKVPFPWHTLRFPWKPNVCSTHIPHKTVEMPQVYEGISRAGQIWFFSPVFKLRRARTRNWQRVVRRRGRIHFLQSLICFLTKAAAFQNKLRFLRQRNDFDPVTVIYHQQDEDGAQNICWQRWF